MPDNRVDGGGESGGIVSPAGFVFGVQGWQWAEPKAKSITFFLDGTAMVGDQYGRPIKGTVVDNKEVKFATSPPPIDTRDEAAYHVEVSVRAKLATHQQVVAALEVEHIDWTRLATAGWPQLPYEQLKKLPKLPPTPRDELLKIPNKILRRDALRVRKEYDEERLKELQADEVG